MRLNTLLIHGSRKVHTPPAVASVIEPLYVSAVYSFHPQIEKEIPHKVPFKYSREDNPTVSYLEEKIKLIEGGEDALAFSSGLAAINTILRALAEPEKTTIVAPLDLYGSSITVLKNLEQREKIKLVFSLPGTKSLLDVIGSLREKDNMDNLIIFFESVSNPLLRVYDIEDIAKTTRDIFSKKMSKNIYIIVDNTIPTCAGARPIELGADITVYSASKYLGGHNDIIGGIGVFKDRDTALRVWDERRLSGTVMDPFTAFLTDRGLKTLALRMRKHEENARAVAEFLREHSKIKEVIYPGLSDHPDYKIAVKILRCTSGIVSFRIRGTLEDALRVCKNTRIIVPGVSFGGTESIITHPYTTTHRYLSEEERRVTGVTPDLIRLSVGLEDPEDLIEDLDRALRSIP